MMVAEPYNILITNNLLILLRAHGICVRESMSGNSGIIEECCSRTHGINRKCAGCGGGSEREERRVYEVTELLPMIKST